MHLPEGKSAPPGDIFCIGWGDAVLNLRGLRGILYSEYNTDD